MGKQTAYKNGPDLVLGHAVYTRPGFEKTQKVAREANIPFVFGVGREKSWAFTDEIDRCRKPLRVRPYVGFRWSAGLCVKLSPVASFWTTLVLGTWGLGAAHILLLSTRIKHRLQCLNWLCISLNQIPATRFASCVSHQDGH